MGQIFDQCSGQSCLKFEIQISNGLYYALCRVAKQVDILKAIRHSQQAHHFCNAVKWQNVSA